MFLIIPPTPPAYISVQATSDIRLPNGNRIGIVQHNANGTSTITTPDGRKVDQIVPNGNRIEHRDPGNGNMRFYEQRNLSNDGRR